MKFLCPSCKAKYQIADEKVSGRAVRMKCRKCGYIIPISEVPPAPPTIAPPGSPDPLPPVPLAPPAPRGLEPPPSSRPAPRPIAVPAPKPAPSPKPGVVRPGSPAVLGTTKGIGVAPAPAALKKVDESPARQKARSGSDLMPAFEDEEEQATAIVSGGALAAAFGKLVSQSPEIKQSSTEHAMPGDEWYVGINDVPVGPIRLTEMRAKAVSGAIRGDSLVWRDGLEDWRPFRTFPELMAVLEESLSSAGLKPPAPVPVPGDGAGKAAFDFGTPLPSGVTGVGVVTDDLAAAGLSRSRTPIIAWIAMGVALAGGLGLGYVFFSKRQEDRVVYRYRDRPTEEAPPPAAANAQDPAAVAPGADSAGAKARPGTKAPGTKQVSATNTDKNGGGLPGLKGLDGLRPSGGPGPGSSPGSTTPVSGGGGSQLDSGQIQGTVSRYTGSVKRSCWQPALDSRDPSAPPSARVQVTITVGPSGSVQNATTNGDPRGYPGLANCIAGRVRSWQFPPSSGTTTAVVPFVFAAQ
jgi:predicted Zn finger-like uncharacterized protein